MLPRIIIHNAISLDGRIDWLTFDLGLFYGLISRWNEDATMVGSNTLLKGFEEQSHIKDEILTRKSIAQDDAYGVR